MRAFYGQTALGWAIGAAIVAIAAPAQAQSDKMEPIAAPAQPNAIPLNTGTLPGATAKESWHSQYGSTFTRNVTDATLTPFLPDPAKANGTAVIVAPGGGFRTLSMSNEGWDVARALAERGVAAFVLKYRLNQTPADMAGFERSMREMFSGTAPRPRPNPGGAANALAPQIADANAAFALVRSRAGEWKVDPKGKAILDAQFPGMLAHDSYPMFKSMSLKQVQPYAQGKITDEQVAKVAAELAKLN